MTELLRATNTAPRAALSKSLEQAAAAGETSIAETLLGALVRRFPETARPEAVRALNCAVYARRWATATYFADFLADTQVGRAGGAETPTADFVGRPPPLGHMVPEIVRCLRGWIEGAAADADGPDRAGAPAFRLTDAIQDVCVKRGIQNASAVAAALNPPHRAAISFDQIDPRAADDAEGTHAAGAPRLFFSLGRPDTSALLLAGGDDPVVPPGTVTVRLDFPRAYAGEFRLETTGTRGSLARAIARRLRTVAARLPPGTRRYDLAELHLVRVRPVPLAPAGRRYVADISAARGALV